MASLTYRSDIDGLRAVAVLAVVFYHLDPTFLPGGFVGVDVFFVISGFLITSIILRESADRTFTLKNFWMRRTRRLFPALAVVLLATLAAGSLILYQQEWSSLGAQLFAVLILIANLHLHIETGNYWGPAAEDAPLLHTWSLAVEEQFYLLFPLLLLLLLRLGKRSIIPLLSLGALASLAHGILITNTNPSYAFYLLPTRTWEWPVVSSPLGTGEELPGIIRQPGPGRYPCSAYSPSLPPALSSIAKAASRDIRPSSR